MHYNYQKIIEYINFKTIHYTINLNIISSFKVFNQFNDIFLSNILLI